MAMNKQDIQELLEDIDSMYGQEGLDAFEHGINVLKDNYDHKIFNMVLETIDEKY